MRWVKTDNTAVSPTLLFTQRSDTMSFQPAGTLAPPAEWPRIISTLAKGHIYTAGTVLWPAAPHFRKLDSPPPPPPVVVSTGPAAGWVAGTAFFSTSLKTGARGFFLLFYAYSAHIECCVIRLLPIGRR